MTSRYYRHDEEELERLYDVLADLLLGELRSDGHDPEELAVRSSRLIRTAAAARSLEARRAHEAVEGDE